MRFILLLTLLISTNILSAQTTFIVDDFSDRYAGKVYISQPAEVFSKGWVAIFDKKTKRQLIKVNSDELTFNLRDGQIVSNIKELPYGEQSPIMYEDYNFDGKKDLALMDGHNSCYHGPSFQIYLATKTGFTRSHAFTRLSQEYCGMFDVDPKTKKIHTITKSTCCWHQYSDFIVRNNKPIAIKIVEEGLNQNGLTSDFTEYNRVGGKLIRKNYSVFNLEDQEKNIIFSFEFNNQKKARLIKLGDTLNYIFTDKKNKVELIYSDQFYSSKEKNTVWFTNNKTHYKISMDGISVSSRKTNLTMKAELGTITGKFSELQNTKFVNVSDR